jgi:hypothetical protein
LTVDLADAPTIEMRAVHSGSSTESAFAEVLADVMGVERVSVDSNFFDDLGADSMVMARFCARVRKRPDLPAVSIKDIYQHRTIKSGAAPDAAPVLWNRRQRPRWKCHRRNTAWCSAGALQLVIFLGYSYLARW